MRRFLLAAALLLVVPTPGSADEEPRADAGNAGLVDYFRLLAAGEKAPRPADRRSDATHVAVFVLGAVRFEAVLDALWPQEEHRLVSAMYARGWNLERLVAWGPDADATEQDAAALVAGDGKLPAGYVPAGREAPGEIPPLSVLGGTMVLEIVGGEARARVTAAPEGSRARKMGLREGDVVLEVDGERPGPRVLLGLDDSGSKTAQHNLKVRRSDGGIERIVIDSWAGPPPAR